MHNILKSSERSSLVRDLVRERFKIEFIAGAWSSKKKGVSNSQFDPNLTITDFIKLSNFTNGGPAGKRNWNSCGKSLNTSSWIARESIGERFELAGKSNIQVIVIDYGSPLLLRPSFYFCFVYFLSFLRYIRCLSLGISCLYVLAICSRYSRKDSQNRYNLKFDQFRSSIIHYTRFSRW